MTERMTDAQFAARVSAMGGVFAALEGGLRSWDLDNLDGPLADQWRDLEFLWSNRVAPGVSAVKRLMTQAVSEELD